jgi:integrase
VKVPDGYKRCKCRDAGGRELGAACPRLRRKDKSWNPNHGTWYGKTDIPAAEGERKDLRAGGFATQDDMRDWFTAAIALLSIPEKGADGQEARGEIADLIRASRKAGSSLPDADDIRRRHAHGAAFQPGSTGDYLLGWLARHQEAGDWSPATLLSYERDVNRLFLPAFGKVPLDKLAATHILKMLARVDDEAERIRAARASADPGIRRSVIGLRPPGPSTKARHLAVIRSALGEAASVTSGGHRLLTVNVAAGIRLGRAGKGRAKAPRRARAVLWTAERERKWRAGLECRCEGLDSDARFRAWRNTAARPSNVMVWKPAHLAAFLDHPDVQADRMYPLLEVTAYCGLRRGEGCGLRWEDMDWDASAFMIGTTIVQIGYRALVQDSAKTEGSEDWVAAAAEVTVTLRAWRKRQSEERLAWGEAWNDTGFMFTREDGTPYHPAQVTARFERLARQAGLPPIRLHDLRHGAATMALAAGKDIKLVSAMLRHSSVKITSDIYATVLPELAAEVSSAVASMIPRRARG